MDEEKHSTMILPVCLEIFKRIEDKVDLLINQTEKIHDKFSEITELRQAVKEHEKKFSQLDVHRRWAIGIEISTITIIAIQIVGFVYLWGNLTKTVEVNSGRIVTLEELHPRVAK
jgi:hypothetical protein